MKTGVEPWVYVAAQRQPRYRPARDRMGVEEQERRAVAGGLEVLNDDYAVIPIENSTEGSVREALDSFVESDVKIVAQIYLEISHALISNSPQNTRSAWVVFSAVSTPSSCSGVVMTAGTQIVRTSFGLPSPNWL